MRIIGIAGIFGIAVLLLIVGFLASALANNTSPSNDQIQNWWKRNSSEEMTIEGKPLQVGLRNKEIAYLVPVGFYGRGRNFILHMVMVRPLIQEVREVSEPVRRDCVIHDLNGDGISEIETVSSDSGQGTERGERAIVQFDGWSPLVLHRIDFYDNLGGCGPPPGGYGQCESKEVSWKFIDLNGDGNDDLIEGIIISKGSQPNKMTSKKTINKYLFKDNAFTNVEAK